MRWRRSWAMTGGSALRATSWRSNQAATHACETFPFQCRISIASMAIPRVAIVQALSDRRSSPSPAAKPCLNFERGHECHVASRIHCEVREVSDHFRQNSGKVKKAALDRRFRFIRCLRQTINFINLTGIFGGNAPSCLPPSNHLLSTLLLDNPRLNPQSRCLAVGTCTEPCPTPRII